MDSCMVIDNQAGEVAQWVEHLLCKCEDPSASPEPMESGAPYALSGMPVHLW